MSAMSEAVIQKQAIARSFGMAAEHYDSVAHFQRWVGEQLLSELSRLELSQGLRILDLGAGTGYFLKPLNSSLLPSSLVAMDLSEGMMRHLSAQTQIPATAVVGDADALPIQAESFDLVFSSLAIQWCADLPLLFREIHRVLKPDGVFAYSTLLDGSLKELKAAWRQVDRFQHVNDFFQFENYRQAANQVGFLELYAEQRQRVLRYPQVKTLTRELKLLGAHNMTPDRALGMTGKARVRGFLQAYESNRGGDGQLPVSYEVGLALLQKGCTE